MLLDPERIAELAARIDPRRAARPAPATNPSGGGTIYLATVDRDGNAVSLIESNYLGFGSGVVDPATGIHYQNRGSYFSLDPDHPNVLEPGKRTLHTLLPGMLFRAGEARPWIVAGSMGGDAQPQIHAQFVSAVVDGGVDVRTAVAAPRWYVEPADHFEPPDGRPPGAAPRWPRSRPRSRRSATRSASSAPFDSGLGHEHAIELVDGGPAAAGRLGRGRHGPAQHGPAGRLLGTATGFCRGPVICDTPAAGGRLRSHEAATGVVIRATREAFVTSNVSQNYPYSSEPEADRAAVDRTPAGRSVRRLAATLAAEASPVDAQDRWWVWKCPTKGCPGLLHAAGYAIEKHAVFVVCDGTCAKTFLR